MAEENFEVKASANGLKMSARKLRLVINEVRGFDFKEAADILRNMPKKGARIAFKALLSAGANAKVLNSDINEDELFIKKIYVDEGPTMKRFRPRARGRADRIFRRTSNLTVVLSSES